VTSGIIANNIGRIKAVYYWQQTTESQTVIYQVDGRKIELVDQLVTKKRY
jgi:hypothetical protein